MGNRCFFCLEVQLGVIGIAVEAKSNGTDDLTKGEHVNCKEICPSTEPGGTPWLAGPRVELESLSCWRDDWNQERAAPGRLSYSDKLNGLGRRCKRRCRRLQRGPEE